MTLLPLVLSFLLILTVVSGFSQSSLTLSRQNFFCLQARLKGEADLRTLSERKVYKKAKKKKAAYSKKTPTEATGNKKAVSGIKGEYFRDLIPSHDEGKLNLGKVLKLGRSDPRYKEIAMNLIRSLYEGRPFWILGSEEKIIDAWTLNSDASWWELFPPKDPMYTVVYKMFKGTNTYDLTVKKGIPPLGDFVYFQEASPLAVFGEASFVVLRAILSASICKEIREKEHLLKGKKNSLTHDQFKELSSVKASASLQDVESFFSWAEGEEKGTLCLIADPLMSVTVRRS